MAILKTTKNLSSRRGSTTLELTPNSPSQPGMVDTYTLRLWVHDQLIYDQVHSVRDWQMRHFYVQEIARAFCCCRELLGQEILCESSDITKESTRAFLSFVHVNLNTEWLTVVLSSTKVKRIGELVHANLYLMRSETTIGEYKEKVSGLWGEWSEMVSSVILCSPDDAIAFGRKLLDEIHSTEEERISLGIPEYRNQEKYE